MAGGPESLLSARAPSPRGTSGSSAVGTPLAAQSARGAGSTAAGTTSADTANPPSEFSDLLGQAGSGESPASAKAEPGAAIKHPAAGGALTDVAAPDTNWTSAFGALMHPAAVANAAAAPTSTGTDASETALAGDGATAALTALAGPTSTNSSPANAGLAATTLARAPLGAAADQVLASKTTPAEADSADGADAEDGAASGAAGSGAASDATLDLLSAAHATQFIEKDTPTAAGGVSDGAQGAGVAQDSPSAAASGAPGPGASDAGALGAGTSSTQLTGAASAHEAAGAASGAQLSAAVGTPAWTEELGNHLTWMAHQGIDTASLKMMPPDLGPIEVRIDVRGADASVWFGAAHAETRAALEQSLPRLRELFSGQGLSLTDSGVFREPPRQQTALTSTGRPSPAAASSSPASVTSVTSTRLGLIDLYA